MLLSERYKFIFVHVWKTGGTSIRYALGHHCLDLFDYHPTAREIQSVVRDWPMYFSFGFVRNPWALQVSHYHYFLEGSVHGRPHTQREQIKSCGSFTEYVRHVVRDGALREGRRTQTDFLVNQKGNLAVNFLGRFERLEEDFAEVVKLIGLPPTRLRHENKTTHTRYQDYYTDETREIVGQVFKVDCDNFGYQFDA